MQEVLLYIQLNIIFELRTLGIHRKISLKGTRLSLKLDRTFSQSMPSICYLHSCIRDAEKEPKTHIPYLFVIVFIFLIPLPSKNTIPPLIFHRAVARGLLFAQKTVLDGNRIRCTTVKKPR